MCGWRSLEESRVVGRDGRRWWGAVDLVGGASASAVCAVRGGNAFLRIVFRHLRFFPPVHPITSALCMSLSILYCMCLHTSTTLRRKRGEVRWCPRPSQAVKQTARIEEPSSGLSAVLASFDFTALPAQLVTEIIVANLQAMPPHVLQSAIQVKRNFSVSYVYLSPLFSRRTAGRIHPLPPLLYRPDQGQSPHPIILRSPNLLV